uniref:ZP domain-containing protein n=1 Tax=Meloidogyne hapla TaxID=6305 RepID=A0A1I8BMA0_MELHA
MMSSQRCLLFKNTNNSAYSLYPRRKLILAINFILMEIAHLPLADHKSLPQKSPVSICSPDSIGILIPNPQVTSDLPLLIYANGYMNEQCMQPFPSGAPLIRLEVQLQFGFPCGVIKRRMVYPRDGLEYSLRVLLDHVDKNEFLLHMSRINGFKKLPKVQYMHRIFDIHCQYFTDHNQTVGQVLEISNSIDGPEVDKAKLGDRVFHRWRCDGRYALKVYRCYATDGRDREHQIIDDKGCSTDISLMPHPLYTDNPSQALASSRVFRFNSSSRIFFDCLLYACLKIDPDCRKSTHQRCSRISSRDTYKLQRQKREITLNSETISSERYSSMSPKIDKFTVRLDTVETNEG